MALAGNRLRCCSRPVRNRQLVGNWITRTIAVEFDNIYALSHQGRSRLSGTAILAVPRLLAQISPGVHKNDPSMLTEDIDASVRLYLTANVLCTTVKSFPENSPILLHGLVLSAQTLAQDVGSHPAHQTDLLETSYLSPKQKSLWFYLWHGASSILFSRCNSSL